MRDRENVAKETKRRQRNRQRRARAFRLTFLGSFSLGSMYVYLFSLGSIIDLSNWSFLIKLFTLSVRTKKGYNNDSYLCSVTFNEISTPLKNSSNT